MNEITSNYYHTQYGSISLSIRTKSIVIKDKPDLFELKMEYSLLSGDSLISDNQIYITLLPAQ